MEYMENFDIEYMSILFDDWNPKNNLKAVVKGEKVGQVIEVTKAEPLKGLLFAEVFKGNIEDNDKHQMTNEEVEKSAHAYMKKSLTKGFKFDINHDNKPLDNVILAENYVDRSQENYTHKIVIDFHDNKELMEKAKTSKINGISPQGYAKIVSKGEDEKEKGMFSRFMDFVKGTKDTYDKRRESSQLWTAWDAFYNNVVSWKENEGEVVDMDIYKAEVKEFAKLLNGMKFNQITKGEDMEKNEFIEFAKTEEGIATLTELEYVKKGSEDGNTTDTGSTDNTDGNTTDTGSTDTEKTEVEKALEELKKANELLTKEIEMVKASQKTGTEIIEPKETTKGMTGDQLKALKENDPDKYQKMLDAEAAERLKQ